MRNWRAVRGKKKFLSLATKKIYNFHKCAYVERGRMKRKKRYIKLKNVILDTTFKKSSPLKEGRKLVSYSVLALYTYNNQHSCWHRTHRQQKSTSFPLATGEKTNAACFTFHRGGALMKCITGHGSYQRKHSALWETYPTNNFKLLEKVEHGCPPAFVVPSYKKFNCESQSTHSY